MRGLLSSARMRRRLTWASFVVFLVGLVVFLAVVVFPSSKPSAAEKMTKQRADVVHTPKHHSFDRKEAPLVLSTAKQFVNTAVRRRHLAASWSLVSPSMKRGISKKEWLSGTEPFPPYPAYLPRARWNLSFSYANEVGLRVALFPQWKSKLKPVVFDLVERKYGHGSGTHWLVSDFTPAPSASGDFGGGGTSKFSPGSAVTVASPVNHVSSIWLILPFGVLVGGLILGLAVFLGYRSWRNAAIYRAYARDHQRSS